MRTFVETPKTSQQTTSAEPSRARFGQSRAVNAILFLQRTIGNQALRRMLQTDAGEAEAKWTAVAPSHTGPPVHTSAAGTRQTTLVVSEPGDGYEREAERMAEQVMRTPEPQLQRACASGGAGRPTCRTQQPGREHATLQGKRVQPGDTGNTAAPPSVHDVLRSPGHALDPPTRSLMEPRFGYDFSRVRVHSDALAARSAQSVNAQAYTVGRDIVFGAGRFSPGTQEGRRLLAHELTHVVQQDGAAAAVQRQPAPDPDAERAAAAAEAEVIAQTPMWYHEEQWEAENRLGLKATKRDDKEYAWLHARRDKVRLQKSGALTAEHQAEIAVKYRFFQGEAKAAYLRTIAPIVSEVAEPEQVQDILAGPPQEVTCDLTQREYVLEYEGDPSKTRCMQVPEDPEFKDLFDDKIKNAVGYAVEGTTWENVEYDAFKFMLVEYKNGTAEFFILDDVGNFYYAAPPRVAPLPTFLKRENGLIYPIQAGGVAFSEVLTPNIISLKEGLKWQIKQLQDLYDLLQLGGAYATIVGAYGVPAGFKMSLQALRRTTTGLPRPTKRTTGSGSKTSTSTGVPEPITDEPSTQRMRPGARVGEVVGEYQVAGDKGRVGDTFRRDIYGLYRIGGKTNDIRPIMGLVREFIAEAKAAGATRLHIVGHVVRNQNVLRIQRLAGALGGKATVTGDMSIEIIIPVN
jgi:hypothetical protein